MLSLLKNRIDFTNILSGFVDRHSQMVVSVSKDYFGIDAVSPRGLVILRGVLTSPSFRLQLKAATWDLPVSLTVSEMECFPWGCQQSGIIMIDGKSVSVSSMLTCPEYNVYVMEISLSSDLPIAEAVDLTIEGKFVTNCTQMEVYDQKGFITFNVIQSDPQCERFYNITPDYVPCWRLSIPGRQISVSQNGLSYVISAGEISLSAPTTIQLVFEMDNRPADLKRNWPTKARTYDVRQAWDDSQQRWEKLLGSLPGSDRPTFPRELRSACILDRCGYRGKYGRWGNYVASFCMITSWASTAYFWDSVFGALGLSEFDLSQAEDALRVLFTFQRKDGCVPTHSYEHMVGSTFYPQAPLVSWAVLKIFRRYKNIAFVKEILPKIRTLFDWNVRTQDQDGDGLIEIRFTGQLADDAPQYDRYLMHLKPIPKGGNIFVPPIASPAWNSFLYMDARCLAELYKIVGDPQNAEAVLEVVKNIPERLMEVCWDEKTQYFQDYDHQIESFNRARVLTAVLPLWAGMSIDENKRRTLIEDNLLNPKRFFGDYPFPYLAYDDPEYNPDGYWRGRVWPHTSTWILELLWKFGYEKEVKDASKRLLTMMNQQEMILENYNSSPDVSGGGSPDYQWSSGTYLYLVNQRYREAEI